MNEKNRKNRPIKAEAGLKPAPANRPALVDEACQALGISNPMAWALVQAADGSAQVVVIDEIGRKLRYGGSR